MFTKKTLKDVSLDGKQVLLRADYNVPIKDGKVTSDFRIQKSLPTIKALQDKNCKIVIIAHLGRPKSPKDTQYSLKPVARELSKLLGQTVIFAGDCIGEDVKSVAAKLKPKEVMLLENLRYYPEEKANDEQFAKELVSASGAELFVQDGFGVVHRAHASTDAVAKLLPSVAGLLLESEVATISTVMSNPQRPLMAIIGGAKIADKIEIIHKFLSLADIVVIGGAMANTFLEAKGVEVGESLVDEDELDVAKDIMFKAREEAQKRRFVFYIPQDGVVSTTIDSQTTTRIVDWDAHVIAEIEAYPAKPKRSAGVVAKHEKILDIGPFSGAFITGAMQMVDTVVWNGTMGVSETPAIHGQVGPFAQGTELVIEGLVGSYGHKPFSIIGGGDTTGYLENREMTDMFDHVSTGGGASLELMSGKKLPGVEVLHDK
ncbi:MAG: 3-phosphoglycerate kinase [Candidatus Saccharimonadales bacterium]|jgi:3-phosphoglycerate kinase